MKFREMSQEMTAEEILLILRIVFPYGKMTGYVRESGYITVYYSLPRDGEEIERRIDFLPDDIFLVKPDSKLADGEPIGDGNILYRYVQYMVAKGYSEYWLDNPYTQI